MFLDTRQKRDSGARGPEPTKAYPEPAGAGEWLRLRVGEGELLRCVSWGGSRAYSGAVEPLSRSRDSSTTQGQQESPDLGSEEGGNFVHCKRLNCDAARLCGSPGTTQPRARPPSAGQGGPAVPSSASGTVFGGRGKCPPRARGLGFIQREVTIPTPDGSVLMLMRAPNPHSLIGPRGTVLIGQHGATLIGQ